MVAFNVRHAGAGALNGSVFRPRAGRGGPRRAQEAYSHPPDRVHRALGARTGAPTRCPQVAASCWNNSLKVSFPVVNVAGAIGQTGLTKMLCGRRRTATRSRS